MVIVKPIGGLANQMFPYAVGRRLAMQLGTELKLDKSGFEVYKLSNDLAYRSYGLDAFSISAPDATSEEIARLKECQLTGVKAILHKMLHSKPPRPSSYVREKSFHFDQGILNLKGDIYLEGNWCSYKYFEGVEHELRKDFEFRNPPFGKNAELIEEIRSVNSVSVHVRRGDFAHDNKINQIYGTCSLGYYRECIEKVSERVDSPKFFVFSDEPQWVKENLSVPFPVSIVDHNHASPHEDMRLMSLCKHNIIANSGFSWWGAWLNANSDKIVCTPRNWFVTNKYDTKDLVPADWLRL